MGLALHMTDRDFPTVSAREDTLDSGIAMEAFLREVETRAFRIAWVSVRDRDEALDIVQDSMIRLVRRYARRTSAEWRPLFYRILQNRIRDSQRRRSVRSRVLSFFGGIDDGAYDPIVEAAAPPAANPLFDAFIAAGRDAGFPLTDDINGAAPEGFGRYDVLRRAQP